MNFFKPVTSQQTEQALLAAFDAANKKHPDRPLQARVHAPSRGVDLAYPPSAPNTPYHVASIGKLFTAVLAFRAAEQARLSLSDPITKFFNPQQTQGLFVIDQTDHATDVTVLHLLQHTSGIADYFEGKSSATSSFFSDVLQQPHHLYTPWELVEYTRKHQNALCTPGSAFNYSDTGYVLLGLLLEQAFGLPFYTLLDQEIFAPLGMHDSYLAFSPSALTPSRQTPEKIWFNNTEISQFTSLSCDWAGGGVFSTTQDLLAFQLALRSGKLISAEHLQMMDTCPHKFEPGIYYGTGGMEIHFKDFFFMLGHLPKLKGHIGILATHMFYDPDRGISVVLNLGDNTRMEESFRLLIDLLFILLRQK